MTKDQTLQHAILTAKINWREDVKTLAGLAPLRDGRWLYLIETPFFTFPRWCVGTCDPALEDVRVEFKCGRAENAREEFDRRLAADEHACRVQPVKGGDSPAAPS